MSSHNSRLNQVLLILVFLGISFIIFKEKEGFSNMYHDLEESYNGAILKNFLRNPFPHKIFDKDFMRQTETNYVGDYEQKTNNPKYRKIPCDKKQYDYNICEALYRENNQQPENKTCNPGFGCRRVGFYCSLLEGSKEKEENKEDDNEE